MSMFCKHKWTKVSDVITESMFENSLKAAKAAGTVGKLNLPHQLCDGDRTHIVILTCDKCGKVKKVVTNI